MKNNHIRKFVAGTAVAAATMLGSQAAVTPAQADIISFSLDLTSRNTTTLNRDGYEYDPAMHATEYFTLDTSQAGTGSSAGNSGYAVLDTLGGQVTTPVDDTIVFNAGGSMIEAGINLLGNTVGFELNTSGTPTFNDIAPASIYEQFLNNYNINGAVQPTAVYAYTSPNSPLFNISSVTMTPVPEPKSAALLLGGGLVALGLKIRRRHELALS
jgi:hypothetical protein